MTKTIELISPVDGSVYAERMPLTGAEARAAVARARAAQGPWAALPLAERIAVIVRHIDEIVTTYQPQQAAVEQVFVNVNPAATLMLGQARGAALAALVMRELPVFEYTALQVKQAVVGQGKAAKEQVQHMVVRMLSLSGTPQADAADGLAVALTHALRNHSLAAQLQHSGLSIKRGRFQP